jgi:L-ribulose-5-phosphate 3-epimerase
MKPLSALSRRQALRTGAAFMAGGALHTALNARGGRAAARAETPLPESAAPAPPDRRPRVCLFSKPLQNRDVDGLADVLGELGLDAVDLTCRPAGHVLPERVADDLPRAHERLVQAGIDIAMLTTAITDAGQGHAEDIVRTAAALGIRHAKLGYYPYRDMRAIGPTLADTKARLKDIAALFAQHGVQAGFHNHSGGNVGSAMWDLAQLLDELPPSIGSYFDLGHATVEGGNSGWRIGLNRLLPRIVMLAVKDAGWERAGDRWRPRWGPLSQGAVRWKEAFADLKQAGFAGPISLHVEYGQHGPPGSDADRALLTHIRRDLAFLRDQLQAARLQ